MKLTSKAGDKMDFQIKAPFEPAGDQPQAIAKLAEGIEQGLRTQGRYGHGQNLHYCPGNKQGAQADLGHCPQQNLGGPAG